MEEASVLKQRFEMGTLPLHSLLKHVTAGLLLDSSVTSLVALEPPKWLLIRVLLLRNAHRSLMTESASL